MEEQPPQETLMVGSGRWWFRATGPATLHLLMYVALALFLWYALTQMQRHMVTEFAHLTTTQMELHAAIRAQTEVLTRVVSLLDTSIQPLLTHRQDMSTHTVTAAGSHEALRQDMQALLTGIQDLRRVVELLAYRYAYPPDVPPLP